jgi:anaerobic selenocysteine-containing dehydrogenase
MTNEERRDAPADEDPETQLARDPERRGLRDDEHGAIYGDVSDFIQPNRWEIAKLDLTDEERLVREIQQNGETPCSRDDESDHGAGISAEPPDELLQLRRTKVPKYAAGLPAVAKALEFAVENRGVVGSAGLLRTLNQVNGYDCPGCAWPDPPAGERSIAEFCENGAKSSAEENTRTCIGPELFAQYSVAELSQRSDYWLAKQGRVAQPMVLREGATHYQPITWDDAFRLIGQELNALHSPDQAAFYTSGRTSNEAAFLYQLFARQFGTNNLPDCSNMCHESSGSALTDTVGIGKATVTWEDLARAEVLISIGQNPGTSHPRMLTMFMEHKQRGGTMLVINPLPEPGLLRFQHPQHPIEMLKGGTKLADLRLPVRINGDIAVLKGIMKELLAEEDLRPGRVFDHEFIRAHTIGYAAYIRELRAAEMLVDKDRIIITWAMGLTQHQNAVSTIQECLNLLLLKGCIGKLGGGALPVRGHSNVQGDRTMGIWERMKPDFLERLGREFDFDPPQRHGYDTVESIRAMHAGKVKVFIGMGGNFLSASPDTEYTAEALRRCHLTAHVGIKLNRSHLVTGRQALILPTLGRAERDLQATGPQFVTTENSLAIIQSSIGRLEPAAEQLRSEPAIVAGMARATLGDRSTVDWEWLVEDYDRIRDRIEHVVEGIQNFNERVRRPGGFYLPNLPRDRREFTTVTGKANFSCHDIPRSRLEPDQLVLMTIRSHDQFNTTVYGLEDRYRGIRNERRVIFMNVADIRERGLHDGQVVDLTSHFEGEKRTARHFIVVAFDIPRRCAATYFPEGNVLVPIRSTAARSNTPTYKSITITVSPSASTGRFDYDRVERSQAPRA